MSTRLRTSLLVTTLTVSLISLAACTPDREPGDGGGGVAVSQESIQLDTGANLRASLGGLSRAILFVNESDFMRLVPTFEGDCVVFEGDVETDCGGESETFQVDFEPSVEDLVDWLDENILIAALVEDSTDTSVTYRIPADLLCDLGSGDSGEPYPDEPYPDEPFPGDPIPGDQAVPDGLDEGGADPECLRILSEVPVRLQISSPRRGDVDVALLIGQGRVNPAKFRIWSDELAVTVDLGKTKDALELLAAAAEEELDLPEVMHGKLEASLKALGGDTYEGTVSVLSAVEIVSMSLDHPMSVRVAAASPALRGVVDGQGHEITAESNIGAVDVTGSLDLLFGSEETCEYLDNGEVQCESNADMLGHMMAFHLGGASARTTYDGANDVITLENLGLGDSTTTFAVDDQQVVGVDVNATHSRRFDMTVRAVEGGVELGVSPAFDLAIELATRHMPNADETPSWALDESLRVTFEGASAPTLRLDDETGAMRVLEGVLKLSSDALGQTIVVNAGQCLEGPEGDETSPVGPGDDVTGRDTSDEGAAHPFDGLEAGVCQ